MNLVFARESGHLKDEILREAGDVEARLNDVLHAIVSKDKKCLQDIMERDTEIDNQEVQIEEECLKILALHQPVARDLRFVIAVLKINNDVERIGDIVVNIADRGARLCAYATPILQAKVNEMGMLVRSMLKKSIDALVELNPVKANEVIAEDDRVDQLNRDVILGVIAAVSTVPPPKEPEALLLVHSMARDLERIGDHATNIAEDVAYLVDGTIIRHSTSATMSSAHE